MRKEPYHTAIIDVISCFADNGIGVEIGVYNGDSSDSILSRTNTKHLYMIDPWISKFSKLHSHMFRHQKQMDESYSKVRKYFSKNFLGRYTIIKKKSEEATSDVPDNLDFIYIDGNHEYDYVMKDLEKWVPKVRSGGLVIGDDWKIVVDAVCDFCIKHDPFLPAFENYDQIQLTCQYIPAPGIAPVVNKLIPALKMWWAIKK